jgi:hypothetical protein
MHVSVGTDERLLFGLVDAVEGADHLQVHGIILLCSLLTNGLLHRGVVLGVAAQDVGHKWGFTWQKGAR